MKANQIISARIMRRDLPVRTIRTIASALATALTMVLVLVAGSAQAQIESLSGDMTALSRVNVVAAGSLAEGALSSDTDAHVFLETRNVVLASDMLLDITGDGIYGPLLTSGTIAAGQAVASVMIHGDRLSSAGLSEFVGEIMFNSDILGVVLQGATLDAWDTVVGVSGVAYPHGDGARGLELDASLSSEADLIEVSGSKIRLNLENATNVDQLRVIVAGSLRGVSFSIDAQGPTYGATPAFGTGLIGAGEILTPGHAGSPGPNRPIIGSTVAPGIMLQASGLGVTSFGPFGVQEIDALSFGRDRGRRLQFSVDEFAVGVDDGALHDVYSEGATGNQEASADVFKYLAPLRPTAATFRAGNRATIDGNGVAPSGRPGVGLEEPNTPSFNDPHDEGDNLDALDLGTTTGDLSGTAYFSLDADYSDWADAGLSGAPNFGSAAASGVDGADILVSDLGSHLFNIYAHAGELGLGGNGEGKDDIDALAVADDGDGIYDPGSDKVFFSLRRGSYSIGSLDTRLGIPITEGDILAPGPAIIIPAESMGLKTARYNQNPSQDDMSDDVDAISLVASRGAPVGQNDQVPSGDGAIVIIDVLANDTSLLGQLNPASVVIMDSPQFGEVLSVDTRRGNIHYRAFGPGTADMFTYAVQDDQGEISEAITVSLVAGVSAVPGDGSTKRKSMFSFAGPNPMHGRTAFKLAPAKSGRVLVDIFDIAGHKVRTLLDTSMLAGEERQVSWNGRADDGRNSAAGLYFIRMKSADGIEMLRVVNTK
jgi:hypothetical protein